MGVPDEEVCRQVITAYVESNFCFGKELINTLVINNIQASNAFTVGHCFYSMLAWFDAVGGRCGVDSSVVHNLNLLVINSIQASNAFTVSHCFYSMLAWFDAVGGRCGVDSSVVHDINSQVVSNIQASNAFMVSQCFYSMLALV